MTGTGDAIPGGTQGVVADFSADKQTFQMPWGKAMMWFFLLSDTFIFGCFLTSYMTVRMSVRDAWPIPSEVFALSFGGDPIPLILVAILLAIANTTVNNEMGNVNIFGPKFARHALR